MSKKRDGGNRRGLSDLYIIQIAIGAQGVTEKYMWYPEREKKLISGKLGTVDISLYSFTIHILSCIENSFKAIGREADFVGLHWRGGEEDTNVPVDQLRDNIESIYIRMFNGFYRALGAAERIIMDMDFIL